MPDPIRGANTPNPVTPISTGQTSAATSTGAANTVNATTTTSTTNPGVDLADVGQTEALLKSIVEAASNTPGVDQTKVSELQQAIASGAYQTNPQSIAQKIVELEAQLGTAGQVQ